MQIKIGAALKSIYLAVGCYLIQNWESKSKCLDAPGINARREKIPAIFCLTVIKFVNKHYYVWFASKGIE